MEITERFRDFHSLIHEVKENYPQWKQGLKRCEDLTQDYLHQLELETLNAIQRSKIANELRKVRKQRREYKNLIELTQGIRDWYGYNNQSFQKMENYVAATIEAESDIKSRVYNFKVLERDCIK